MVVGRWLCVMIMLTRKGVGKALMSQVMREMMERDLHSVYAYVRRDNKVGL